MRVLIAAAVCALGTAGLAGAAPQFGGGGKIVFTSTRLATGPDIYIMNADGSGLRPLTRDAADDARPSLSPDGKQIVFVSGRGHPVGSFKFDLWVMNADGTGVRRLTSDGTAGAGAWSPGGRWIVYYRGTDLWEIHANGTGLHRLAREAYLPAWSADGKRLAFVRAGGIWVMNANGSGQHQVLSARTAEDPAWSPDGKHIAFDWSVAAANGQDVGSEIWVMNANGTGRKRLTHNRVVDADPTWSPDGKWIAFASDRGADHFQNIWVMHANGTDPKALTTGHGLKQPGDDQPDWQRVREPG